MPVPIGPNAGSKDGEFGEGRGSRAGAAEDHGGPGADGGNTGIGRVQVERGVIGAGGDFPRAVGQRVAGEILGRVQTRGHAEGGAIDLDRTGVFKSARAVDH